MAWGTPVVVVPVVVPVLVVSLPVEVDEDEDADAPDVTPEVEEAPPTPPAPPVPEEEAVAEADDFPEQDVLDGVVEPLPLPVVVVAADPVVVPAPVTGGILMGTLADEHTDVTASETED